MPEAYKAKSSLHNEVNISRTHFLFGQDGRIKT